MSDLTMNFTGSADAVEEAMKDYNDGAALRRLREVLPETGHLVLLSMRPPARPWAIHAYMAEEIPATLSAAGLTIAEAADKCREALG